MDEYHRDLIRLRLLQSDNIGLERLNPVAQAHDFFRYYFTRFLTNIRDEFKHFGRSEISDFSQRHPAQLRNLYQDRTLALSRLIVPIPKGMILSYPETLTSFKTLLQSVDIKTLALDLSHITQAIARQDITGLPASSYTQEHRDRDLHSLAKMFGKTGLTHMTADVALVSMASVSATATTLTNMTLAVYPVILHLQESVTGLEKKVMTTKMTPAFRKSLAQSLLSVGYRLSVASTVINRLQTTEHRFVQALDVLLHA